MQVELVVPFVLLHCKEMSISTSSKYTLAGTTVDNVTPSFAGDIRLYDNESTYIGENASSSNMYGIRNTVVGYNAALDSLRGVNNVLIGFEVSKTIGGNNNVILGSSACKSFTTASDNVVLGTNANSLLKTCFGNVAIGKNVGNGLTDGDYNVMIGYGTTSVGEEFESSAYGTIVVGANTQAFGVSNLVVGSESTTTGQNNVVLGSSCLLNNTSNCIVIGNRIENNGAGCILIGDGLRNTEFNNNVLNIADVLKRDVVASKCNVDLVGDQVRIRNKTSLTYVNVDDFNVVVNARSLFDVKSETLFEQRCDFKDVVDVFKLNVSSSSSFNASTTFNSSIALCSSNQELWTMRLTNKHPSGKGSDLSFVCVNNPMSTFTITDEFQPEILNFTGKHRCKLLVSNDFDVDPVQGMIVVATGEFCNLQDESVIGIDESIPIVRISSVANDARAFGVICSFEDEGGDMRSFNIGNIRMSVEKKSPRVIVNSVGEGAILVCGENGTIRNGDLLVTSSTPGIAMKQCDDVVRACTVAKATCDCYFSKCNEQKLIGCTYKF